MEEEQQDIDLPWWTEKEEEESSQELHFLKQFDQKADKIRDMGWMYFRREVLDKYRNKGFCDIGSKHISFLRQEDKKTAASTVNFIGRNFANVDGIVLMVQAQDYINVPPRQRPHWQRYEIQESQIQLK